MEGPSIRRRLTTPPYSCDTPFTPAAQFAARPGLIAPAESHEGSFVGDYTSYSLRLSSSPLFFSNFRLYMPNYAPRVSLPFNDLSGVIQVWAQTCEAMVVYEHTADAKVTTTHCHILMINSKYATPEQYKRQLLKDITTSLTGNGLWKWASKYGTPDMNFITYMTKGNLAFKYIKNITPDVVEELRCKWSEPTLQSPPTIQTKKEKEDKALSHWEIIQKIRANIEARPKDRITREAGLTAKYTFDTIYLEVMKELRINKVRTSRNELERFIVTLIRDDENFQDEIKEGIKKNIFRSL